MQLGSTLQVAASPHSLESVSGAVAAVFPAIEIVDDHYLDFVAREPDGRTGLGRLALSTLNGSDTNRIA